MVETIIKRVVRRIRVVIHGVWARMIEIHGPRLVNDDLFGLVVGDVNDVVLYRCDLNSAFFLGDELIVVAFQVARRVGAVTERFDRGDDVRLLCNNGFSHTPGPVEIFIQEFNNVGVVEQGDD